MKRKHKVLEAPAERAYARALQTCSAFDLLDQGQAKLLTPTRYPAPLRRLLTRTRTMVHVKSRRTLG